MRSTPPGLAFLSLPPHDPFRESQNAFIRSGDEDGGWSRFAQYFCRWNRQHRRVNGLVVLITDYPSWHSHTDADHRDDPKDHVSREPAVNMVLRTVLRFA
jgi:hypothetical protein